MKKIAMFVVMLIAGQVFGQGITYSYPATFKSNVTVNGTFTVTNQVTLRSAVYIGGGDTNANLKLWDAASTNWIVFSTAEAMLQFNGLNFIDAIGGIDSARVTNAMRLLVYAQSMSTNISPLTVTPRFLGDELICTASNGFWKTITGITTNDWKFFVYQ